MTLKHRHTHITYNEDCRQACGRYNHPLPTYDVLSANELHEQTPVIVY